MRRSTLLIALVASSLLLASGSTTLALATGRLPLAPASVTSAVPAPETPTPVAARVVLTHTSVPPASTTTSTTVAPATSLPVTTLPAVTVPASTTPVTTPVLDDTARVIQIMDATGFNWRAAGITVRIAFFPAECCHWGIYDDKTGTLYIGPTAFGNTQRLEYVVRHELGHGWQYHTGHMQQLLVDLAPWGRTGRAGIEAGADCIASIWGATMWNYWSCPPAAKALMERRLAGDWS